MSKVLARTAAFMMCVVFVLTFNALGAPSQSTEGCSHGFWKNHAQLWPSPYTSQTTFSSVGGLSAETLSAVLNTLPGEPQIMQLLSFTGGPSSQAGEYGILLRAFAASLLNAAHPSVNFGLSSSDVVNELNTLFAVGGGRSAFLALASRFESYNNMGCPLD